MKINKQLFKNRNYAPIAFFIAGISLAQPKQDLVVFGILLVLFGELMRIWGMSYTGADSTSLESEHTKLVTNGAYAFIRNPIFAGNIFMSIGMIIALGGWLPHLLFIGLFFFPIMYQLIAAYEEHELREKFGDAYDEYKRAVPRFYPRLSPYPGRTQFKPDISNALKNERNMFLAISIMIIVFAIRWTLITSG